jgi:hypothetical protein
VTQREIPHEKQAEQLTRLLLTSRDFQLALSAVTFLLEDVDWEQRYGLAELRRFYCYEAAFIVSYARPFVTARGGVRPFSWKDVSLERSEPEKALHTKLLLDRNKLVAHSDADYVEVRRVVYRARFPEREPYDFAMPRYDEGLRLSYEECRTAEILLHKAKQGIRKQVQTLKDIAGADFRVIDLGDL